MTRGRATIVLLLTVLMPLVSVETPADAAADRPAKRVLVWTRNFTPNGTGYVHDNIANNITAIRQLGAANGFAVDHSEEPTVFTDATLRGYQALIFANANNQSFETEEQKGAFQRYIRAGGGFVAIHSACAVERSWEWYWRLVGGTFVVHAKYGPFTIQVVDRSHPATAHLGATWAWTDEFYVLHHREPGVQVLLTGDLAASPSPELAKRFPHFGNACPLAWCQVFEGGRSFATMLGHNKDVYLKDEAFRQHLLGGIRWAMGEDAIPAAK